MSDEDKRRAIHLFAEWIDYLQEAGTKFNLPPRQDLSEAREEWIEIFSNGLDYE